MPAVVKALVVSDPDINELVCIQYRNISVPITECVGFFKTLSLADHSAYESDYMYSTVNTNSSVFFLPIETVRFGD